MLTIPIVALVTLCTYGPDYDANTCLKAQEVVLATCATATGKDAEECRLVSNEMAVKMEDATTKSVSVILYGNPNGGDAK